MLEKWVLIRELVSDFPQPQRPSAGTTARLGPRERSRERHRRVREQTGKEAAKDVAERGYGEAGRGAADVAGGRFAAGGADGA